jgi:hypothetical protein
LAVAQHRRPPTAPLVALKTGDRAAIIAPGPAVDLGLGGSGRGGLGAGKEGEDGCETEGGGGGGEGGPRGSPPKRPRQD